MCFCRLLKLLFLLHSYYLKYKCTKVVNIAYQTVINKIFVFVSPICFDTFENLTEDICFVDKKIFLFVFPTFWTSLRIPLMKILLFLCESFLIFLSWLYFKIFVHGANFQCFFTYLFDSLSFYVFTNFNKSYKMKVLGSAMWGWSFNAFARMTWYEASTKIDKSFDKLYLTIKSL